MIRGKLRKAFQETEVSSAKLLIVICIFAHLYLMEFCVNRPVKKDEDSQWQKNVEEKMQPHYVKLQNYL